MNRGRIQDALSYVHANEKQRGVRAAVDEAIRVLALSDDEAGVLRRALNLEAS